MRSNGARPKEKNKRNSDRNVEIQNVETKLPAKEVTAPGDIDHRILHGKVPCKQRNSVTFTKPSSSQYFNDIIDHLVKDHSDKEIKFRQVCDNKLKTICFKIIPDLCREQGRTITVNKIHISRCGDNPKDSPLKKVSKIEKVEKNTEPNHYSKERDPLITEECNVDDTVLFWIWTSIRPRIIETS